jgi:hypothetical protein
VPTGGRAGEKVEDDTDEQEPDFELSVASAAARWTKLEHCIDQVLSLTEAAHKRAIPISSSSVGRSSSNIGCHLIARR